MRALVTSAVVVVLAVLVVGAGGCCPNAAAPRAGAPDPAEPERHVVPGEYVFTVAPGTTAAAIRGTLADLAPRRILELGRDRILVEFAQDPGLSRLTFRLGDGRLLDVQPNVIYRTRR